MREIEIKNPRLNHYDQRFRRYSIEMPGGVMRAVTKILDEYDLAAAQPKLAELCPGDAPIAYLATQRGLRPENITAIDMCHTDTPLVEGLNWAYLDLDSLIMALLNKEDLPKSVEKLRGQFDLVFLTLGFLRNSENNAMCAKYFAKISGRILVASV